MKLIKMLRTVELPDGKFDGDISYKFVDARADALIADGSAVLIKAFPEEAKAKAEKEKKEEKAQAKKRDSKKKREKNKRRLDKHAKEKEKEKDNAKKESSKKTK